MKNIFLTTCFFISIISCNQKNANTPVVASDTSFNKMLDNYFEQRMVLYPLEATQNGDNRYNDQLPINITDAYKETLKNFYANYLDAVEKFDTSKLNANDLISYKIFDREMKMQLEALDLNLIVGSETQSFYIPFQQFWGLPITMGQLGSGEGFQPFKTEKDYTDWLSRLKQFSIWCDSAIVQFDKGIAHQYVLPKSLVIKMIPQMEAMTVKDTSKNIFYGPIKKFPADFTSELKNSLTQKYTQAIDSFIIPSYQKLASYFKDKYLPAARSTSGINALPNGEKIYDYMIRYWTTTDKTADEIYNTGLAEVKRIRTEMERIKDSVGFKGDLKAFFEYIKTDKKFIPFKKPEDVLNAFREIQKRIDPNLKSMFGRTPKTPFEIRQTEAFRAASASAEYNQGSPDGTI
jgi:uncharacterized protein (DUF885 family)